MSSVIKLVLLAACGVYGMPLSDGVARVTEPLAHMVRGHVPG